MVRKLLNCLLVFCALSCNQKSNDRIEENSLRLWYKQPAKNWFEALPIGNGRIGAMVHGDINNEIIQFNEESLWAGSKKNHNNPQSLKYLDEVRNLLLDNKNYEALELAQKYIVGSPPEILSYQTFGDIKLNFYHDEKSITNYERSLDLPTGICKVKYFINKTLYKREVFVSAVDDVIAINITKSGPDKISFNLGLEREKDAKTIILDNGMIMAGQIIDVDNEKTGLGGNHMKFESHLNVKHTGGSIHKEKEHLEIVDADEVTIYIAAHTNYNINNLDFDETIDISKKCEQTLNIIRNKSYDKVKTDHSVDHESIFNRVAFKISKTDKDTIPTDTRLEIFMKSKNDKFLTELYFQYGRYLLMGSSRNPGVLPANLQGIWSKGLQAPWDADYHLNINLQMNYWMAHNCNLPETMDPYVSFFDKLRIPGSETASQMYGAQGWTVHHLTNPFGASSIMDAIKWGTFPMASAWCCFPIWRHFEYTQDTIYLKDVAWPILKGAAEFAMSFPFEGKEGYLATAPSSSPENMFFMPGTEDEMKITHTPTVDIILITELLSYCIEAAEVIGHNAEFINEMRNTLSKLPPIKIGRDSTIQEWYYDYKEIMPGHAHTSHLIGLYPGNSFGEYSQELINAAEKTLFKKVRNCGVNDGGWPAAWRVNMFARLKNAEMAYDHINRSIYCSSANMLNFALFQGLEIYQIDANLGTSAGIVEMLMQCHKGELELLPALPKEWDYGEISGIVARGGFVVDIQWEENELKFVRVKSKKDMQCNLKYKNKKKQIQAKAGEMYVLNNDLLLQ